MEASPRNNVPTASGKPSWKSGGLFCFLQYFFVDIFPDQMMTIGAISEEQNLLYSKLLCELPNKHLSIAPNRCSTRLHACIYNTLGKYSDPLTFSTFC
uniref:Uncharacterized protein n=1 Tax=Salmo trutta TaxID=8032 RepID=A0A673W9T3_SALTR